MFFDLEIWNLIEFGGIWVIYGIPFADKKKVKVGVKGSSGLSWSVRYKVALGIAQAIAYLHNGTERCVVHRDIKPSNILLSSKKIPKVRGFVLWFTISHLSGSVVFGVNFSLRMLFLLTNNDNSACSCVISV